MIDIGLQASENPVTEAQVDAATAWIVATPERPRWRDLPHGATLARDRRRAALRAPWPPPNCLSGCRVRGVACWSDLRASRRGTEQDEGRRVMRAYFAASLAGAGAGLLILAVGGIERAANRRMGVRA